MATNLQVDNVIGATVQPVKDATGQSSALAISSSVVGIKWVGRARRDCPVVADEDGGRIASADVTLP